MPQRPGDRGPHFGLLMADLDQATSLCIMDLGDLIGSRFTTFAEGRDDIVDPDRKYLRHRLRLNRAKMDVARRVCDEAKGQYAEMRHLLRVATVNRRPGAAYTFRIRLSSLETTIHLLQRYLLILSRDGLAIQAQLRGSVPAVYCLALRETERVIVARAPNVHDHFLWEDSYDDEEDAGLVEADSASPPPRVDLLRVPGGAVPRATQRAQAWRVVEELEVPRVGDPPN